MRPLVKLVQTEIDSALGSLPNAVIWRQPGEDGRKARGTTATN